MPKTRKLHESGQMVMNVVPDRGHRYERTQYGDLEKAFADLWEDDENSRQPGLNHGQGLLQGGGTAGRREA